MSIAPRYARRIRESELSPKPSNDTIGDGSSSDGGVLALGYNCLVAFMTFDGYNFEDAIVVSEKLVKEDAFTSIHIDDFDVEVRETKLGRQNRQYEC